MYAETADKSSRFIIICKDGPPIPITAEGLCREEACGGNITERTSLSSPDLSAKALRSVFQKQQIISVTDGADSVIVRRLSEQIHGNHYPGAVFPLRKNLFNRFLKLQGIHVIGVPFHINKNNMRSQRCR